MKRVLLAAMFGMTLGLPVLAHEGHHDEGKEALSGENALDFSSPYRPPERITK